MLLLAIDSSCVGTNEQYGPDNLTAFSVINFEHNSVFRVFYGNQTGYSVLPSGFDLTFYNCYIVEMNLKYTAHYGPTNGIGNFMRQIVMLVQDLFPIWVGIDTTYLIF
jgi:hypothetical protein